MAESMLDVVGIVYQSAYITNAGLSSLDESPYRRYIEVPVLSDIVEIPCIVLSAMSRWDIPKEVYSLVKEIATVENKTYYSTFTNNLKLAFRDFLKNITKLVDGDTCFWVGRGVIFDAHWNPMIMTSVQFSRTEDTLLVPLNLILRVSTDCFVNKDNKISRWITGKFLKDLLQKPLCIINPNNQQSIFKCPELIVGDFPFAFYKNKCPDFSVDSDIPIDEYLLSVVQRNIETTYL